MLLMKIIENKCFNYEVWTITHSPTDNKFCFSSFFIRGRPGFIFKGEVGVFWAAGWMKCANSSVCFNKYSNLFARSVCCRKILRHILSEYKYNFRNQSFSMPLNNELSNKKELLRHAKTSMSFKSIIQKKKKKKQSIILSKRSQTQKDYILWFHLHEIIASDRKQIWSLKGIKTRANFSGNDRTVLHHDYKVAGCMNLPKLTDLNLQLSCVNYTSI